MSSTQRQYLTLNKVSGSIKIMKYMLGWKEDKMCWYGHYQQIYLLSTQCLHTKHSAKVVLDYKGLTYCFYHDRKRTMEMETTYISFKKITNTTKNMNKAQPQRFPSLPFQGMLHNKVKPQVIALTDWRKHKLQQFLPVTRAQNMKHVPSLPIGEELAFHCSSFPLP